MDIWVIAVAMALGASAWVLALVALARTSTARQRYNELSASYDKHIHGLKDKPSEDASEDAQATVVRLGRWQALSVTRQGKRKGTYPRPWYLR